MTGPMISLIALSKATSMILLYCNCGPRELSFSLILKYISARGMAAIS
uniref:Uncharacterized protein n=1 Tax=Arundo donax TaxID=35708 RepID=A0A0A9CSF6_ARUDO